MSPSTLLRCARTPIVIQTDWFPESEYGAVYNLLGDDYEVDVDNKNVSGSLISQGQPTGVDVEIRAGGAAGSGDVETLMYTDDAITFAFGTTDGQILAWENTPLMSVVAPLEISPLMIMWDPGDVSRRDVDRRPRRAGHHGQHLRRPDVHDRSVGDGRALRGSGRSVLRRRAVTVHRRGRGDRPAGVRLRPSRSCTRTVFEDWLRPVDYELIHDAGFQTYSQTLAIRPDDLESLRPCLEAFVPVVAAFGGGVRHRSGAHQRGDRRHRRAVRHVLGVHAPSSPSTR